MIFLSHSEGKVRESQAYRDPSHFVLRMTGGGIRFRMRGYYSIIFRMPEKASEESQWYSGSQKISEIS